MLQTVMPEWRGHEAEWCNRLDVFRE